VAEFSYLFTDTPGAGALDIIDFEYVAYGNAQGLPPNVQCQHGAPECLGNAAEMCVKNMTNADVPTYMGFSGCLETKFNVRDQDIEKCATEWKVDFNALKTCYTGPQGDELITAAAKATPDHGYVPYILYNGKPYDNYNNVIKDACKDWTGAKPSFCKSLELPEPCYKN